MPSFPGRVTTQPRAVKPHTPRSGCEDLSRGGRGPARPPKVPPGQHSPCAPLRREIKALSLAPTKAHGSPHSRTHLTGRPGQAHPHATRTQARQHPKTGDGQRHPRNLEGSRNQRHHDRRNADLEP
ncbi:hypothetical protein NDU88_001346 [Pleurodeles waltl]|uniref:Uncharacterized protein n=1 Tax=Pleurodeles waltl TaxID=8319 RepID=A0AAV7VYX2_PLEWA|nr:hypothetical protein NDU88_001346 [Pleurodeles waltl]